MIKSSRVFVIYYRRQSICDDFFLFTPCNYGEGSVSSEDHLFIDDTGNTYNPCDSYEIITNPSQDLTYFFDISALDLKDRYHLANEYEALSNYYEEIKNFVLFGRVDSEHKFIDIMPLDKKQIKALTEPVTYATKEGEGTVLLTSTQLKTILGYKRLSDVRRVLGAFVNRANATKRLVEDPKNNLSAIQTSFDGRHIGAAYGQPVLATKQEIDAMKKKKKEANQQPKSVTYNDVLGDKPIPVSMYNTKEIYETITSSLIGQDDIVQDIVSIVVSNMQATDPKEIIKPFIIGQTGSGKSLLFKLLADILGVPVITIDCNMITQEGYKGKSVLDILVDLYYLCDKDTKKAERAIIFLDEADKIAAHGNDVSDIGAQQALLKLIEGNRFAIDVDKYGNKAIIDTSMMTIAGGGAFEQIFAKTSHALGFSSVQEIEDKERLLTIDELCEYGMTKEFVGRWSLFRQYHPITKKMLLDNLERGKLSPIALKSKAYLRDFGITIDFTPSYRERLCDEAIARQSGFRGLDERVNNSLIKAQFALQTASAPYKKLIVTSETIENPHVYELVR